MYYDHSAYMYYDHSTCMYYDHSTCMYYADLKGVQLSAPKMVYTSRASSFQIRK